jgi:hypothetical protein
MPKIQGLLWATLKLDPAIPKHKVPCEFEHLLTEILVGSERSREEFPLKLYITDIRVELDRR